MTTKEHLKQEYQHYYCELGSNHIDTKVAKQLYDNYCIAEQETIDKVCLWLQTKILDPEALTQAIISLKDEVKEVLHGECNNNPIGCLSSICPETCSKFIDEEELDKLAEEVLMTLPNGEIDTLHAMVYIKRAYKAGYHKAMEEQL